MKNVGALETTERSKRKGAKNAGSLKPRVLFKRWHSQNAGTLETRALLKTQTLSRMWALENAQNVGVESRGRDNKTTASLMKLG